ncbi:MAG: aminotransferase class V-fold PLP-dependent enzyme [Pseudomonadota bacterium]
MSLSQGRHFLAIPGPSVMPDRVLQAMHRAAPNIYTGDIVDLTHSLIPDLKAVAQTTGDVAIYIANGHGVWEAAIANTLSAGDTVLVLATGRFCIGWGEMARAMGIEVEIIDFGKRRTIDPDQVETALRADTDHKIKAVMAVHVDTSTSVKNDLGVVRGVMDQVGHPALLFGDCIASLGCDPFPMDACGVDVMVAGCQKGLMTPPGIGFVFFNEKAKAARAQQARVSLYWDWMPRVDPDFYYQFFCGTAPTHHLYGLREALDMINEEGLDHVFARHAQLAQSVWAAVDAWGQGGPMALNITDSANRSTAVTSVRIGAPDGTRLREWVEGQAGVTLGIGLGMAEPGDPAWHGFFRIGHMGHVNVPMVMGVLGAMDAGLKALNIPHGDGALAAASSALAPPLDQHIEDREKDQGPSKAPGDGCCE